MALKSLLSTSVNNNKVLAQPANGEYDALDADMVVTVLGINTPNRAEQFLNTFIPIVSMLAEITALVMLVQPQNAYFVILVIGFCSKSFSGTTKFVISVSLVPSVVYRL